MENLGMNPTFWQNQRVFITGHTGFKGAWLCLLLHHLGSRVIGFSTPPPTEPSLFQLARIAELTTSIEGDVRDLPALQSALARSQPPIVIHMAAQSLVRESYRNPLDTCAVNVMGTANLLEAVRSAGHGVRAVVVVTSDKCYEKAVVAHGCRETDPLGGHDPYSSSKAAAEIVTAAYRRSFFARTQTAIATARAGNVIGGGDWATDRLIPDLLRGFNAGQPAVLRNPASIRPWQFVLDPLVGYLALAERLCADGQMFAEPFNFGPEQNSVRSVGWIADQLVQRWGGNASWKLAEGEQPHEAVCLQLNSSKAKERLDWSPRIDLEIALDWIVDWHQSLRDGQDMRTVSQQQIARFLNHRQQR